MWRILFTLPIIFFIVLGWFGHVLTRPIHRSIGFPPADLHAESISLRGNISGWFVKGKPKNGVILLLHGVRSDRRQMVDRARFLNHLNYSVLLIDLPAQGESDGTRITFGARESVGVDVALEWLTKSFPEERIGVIGVSLGAASFVFSKSNALPSAVVLESMYPTLKEAIANRLDLRLGRWGGCFAPLLTYQLPLFIHVSADELCPIKRISEIHCPVLIVSGAEDRHTPLDESRRVYEAANQPKEIWIVEKARHVDLHAFSPDAYELKIRAFFSKYLLPGK